MGLFKRPGKDDESIIEVSNDSGDHVVIHVPTREVKNVEKELRRAGCERDNDGHIGWVFGNNHEQREYERRDHDQHRYRSARVVDEEEDLEDSYDREDDDEREPNEQPAWRWW